MEKINLEQDPSAARDASPAPFKEQNTFIIINGTENSDVEIDLESEASPRTYTLTEVPEEAKHGPLQVSEGPQIRSTSRSMWEKEMTNLGTSPQEEHRSRSTLLNNAVTKHEKDCVEVEDEYASTLAICNMFNPESNTQVKYSDDRQVFNSDEDASEDILITDLDALSCDLPIGRERGGLPEGADQQNESEIDHDMSRSVSPNIVLLDLQSQDEYVADFLNREESESEKLKKEEMNLLQSEQIQPPTTPNECFSIESESVKDIREKGNSIFHAVDNGEILSDFVKEKKLHTSPVLFHDLNEYEQFLTKSFERSDSVDCDAVFFVPISYCQTKDENRSSILSDRFSCNSPHQPLNMRNTDMDYDGTCYEFPVNDSGFFDTSHISAERSCTPHETLPEFSFKVSNQNVGTAKCNLNRQFTENINSSVTSSVFKMGSPYVSQSDNQLQIPGCVPVTSSFCFQSVPNPTMPSTLPFNKQSIMDYNIPFQQNLPGYSDLAELCSSSCSEWNTWNPGQNHELPLSAVTPSHYVNTPHLQQSKCMWHGEAVKAENTDFYQEYTKPAINDNDSEETEDADEIEDVPLLLNASTNFLTGYERQWPPHSNSYYNEAPLGYQMGLENMTPGLVSSNVSSDASGLQSPVPMPPAYSKPQTTLEKAESNFLNYDIPPIPKLPFPSMADMMRSGRSTSTKSSGVNTKRVFSDSALHVTGSRFRKNQIQSDAISTSTSKGPRYKKKWSAESKTRSPDNISDIFINLDGLEDATQNRGPRRHNEPLKQNAIGIMSQWYEEHLDNPYPTKADKIKMAKEGGITVTQVKSWFANKRNRTNNTKPKVQKRAMEEKLKELFKDITCNSSMPLADNSHIINQLSGIIQTCNSNKME